MSQATPAECATCLAIRHNGMTVETAHIAGMIVGLVMASAIAEAGWVVREDGPPTLGLHELAERIGRQHLCDEHYEDMRISCKAAQEAARRVHP